MFFELLVLIGAMEFVWSAVQTDRQTHAGVAGYATVIAIGLILGTGYEVAIHKLADRLYGHLEARSASYEKWFFRGIFVFSVVFPLVASSPIQSSSR